MDNRKELKYFNIGKSYGGNQRWMIDPWMHIGGCAALTTCDALIYFALHRGKPELCPYPAKELTKKEYRKFAMSVRPYLQPRESGIKDLDTYIEGVKAYFEDIDENDVDVKGFRGEGSVEEAVEIIRGQIDKESPVAYLMLKHQDKEFDFFHWHWFLVIGYEQREDDFYIKVATYGKEHWLPFYRLWDTGYDEKGGLVIFEL